LQRNSHSHGNFADICIQSGLHKFGLTHLMFESYQRVLGGCISKRVSVRKALTGFASVVLL